MCWQTRSCPSSTPSHTWHHAVWLPPSPGQSMDEKLKQDPVVQQTEMKEDVLPGMHWQLWGGHSWSFWTAFFSSCLPSSLYPERGNISVKPNFTIIIIIIKTESRVEKRIEVCVTAAFMCVGALPGVWKKGLWSWVKRRWWVQGWGSPKEPRTGWVYRCEAPQADEPGGNPALSGSLSGPGRSNIVTKTQMKCTIYS